ncbi:MAG TPA: M20/M25/M40 family metallo-hydrolase [Chloroflexia bacterium]|nr:M20/M25/M40 family metallo-hydrolase [Chloroflexia bacterium]
MSPETLLAQLVACDSRNPGLVPEAAGEGALAQLVAGILGAAGLEVTLIASGAGRPSVIGRRRGTGGGRTLLLNGHLDTVGFGGMDAPLLPRVADGRLYGRGAYDMKGGLAAILAAALTLARERPLPGDLIVTAVADEEHSSAGTTAVLAYLDTAPPAAAGAIVAEPTDLQIAIAHKGFAWLEIATQGRAAHGSRRAEGVDAILHMGRVLQGLHALDQALQERPAHPRLGHASLHASRILGGGEWSTYPAACRLDLERRTLPGETAESVTDEIARLLDRLGAADPQFHASYALTLYRPPLETDAAAPIVHTLQAAAATITGQPPALSGATFWMDAALLGAAGIPSVAFGPRGAGLHADVEWVDLASVQTCADVLVATARAFCG